MITYPFQIPSGTNIIPDISGINNLGSLDYPFSGIYAVSPIIQSPNGSYWRITVDDVGVVSGVAI